MYSLYCGIYNPLCTNEFFLQNQNVFPRRCFFCGSFLLFMFRVCHAFLSVHCSLAVTCWERADLLAFLYVMFYCVFVVFILFDLNKICAMSYVLGQVWCLIVSIPDLCLLSCFHSLKIVFVLFDLILYVPSTIFRFNRDGVSWVEPAPS